MSVRLMGAVFYLDLPSQEKLLLLAICDHTDDDGQQAFPSQVRLARKTSVSTRTVNRLTHALEGRGLISVKPGCGLETTRYYVNVERVMREVGPDNLSGVGPDAGVRGSPDMGVRTVLTNPVGGPDIAMSAKPSVTTTTKEPPKKPVSGKPDTLPLAREILDWLNRKSGRTYRPVPTNLDFIRARLRDGIEPWQLKAIVSRKVREWNGDPKMRLYLRPETLFNKTKCEQYVGELPPPEPEAEDA